MKQRNISIVLTDSGLGGMFIAAELAERLKVNGAFERARLIFLNCRPARNRGFDAMETMEERKKVFQNVLETIKRLFDPDAVLVACNTLSVLYEQRMFDGMNIFGIVEPGVEIMEKYLLENPDACMIMFGAPTTVASGAHMRMLISRGIAPERLVYQSTEGLPGVIENGPDSEATRALLKKFAMQAINNLPDRSKPAAICLNCTHFGCIRPLFENTFQELGLEPAAILDPNTGMVDDFISKTRGGGHSGTDISFEVFSGVEMTELEKTALVPLLRKISIQASEALCNAKSLTHWDVLK